MSRADCDRNLLLGILALQNNFIDRHDLVTAFDRWTANKARSIGDILVELGKLDAEQHQLLDALVAQHLKQHGGDAEKSLAAVSSLGSVRKELEQVADPDVQASLAGAAMCSLGGNRAADPFAPTISAGTRSSSGMRFTVLRPHAKGGLGQVSVALDEELNREVAFKEIQDRFADDPNSRSRFLLEAEVTGGLEHPGIVPVYGLGQYADGRPFYAMRFIRGNSLQEAIKRFHDADNEGRDPGQRSLELRKLLGRFIDVCNAVEYAHSRGVLHRDLKPGNVMLGRYGETLVVDWGLAKALVHRESETEGGERTLRPALASGSAQTQMGSAIGTPQYMSPEQAGGRLDELGPATDVYSLGGTLYCLLAGRAPFAEGDAGTILSHVSKGEFPPPRAVKTDVPPALQAICLKAMALKPTERYASARALADDVEHWLADEPVAAHREAFVERSGRWLRRHQAAARAAAVVLVLLSVLSSLAAVLINAARGEAQRQRDIARDAQRAEAAQVVETKKALTAETAAKNAETAAKNAETAAKNEAKAAIDRYVETVQESELLNDERFQPLRRKLLAGALSYYQAFIEAHQHDAAARHDLAMALYKVGRISDSSGSKSDALAAYQGALNLQEELAAKNPTVTEYLSGQAVSFLHLGGLQRKTGDRDAALISYQRAFSIREKLAAENPTVSEYQSDLATSYSSIAILQDETGDRDAALVSYQFALAIQEKLAAENPTMTEHQGALAKSYNNIGNLHGETGDREAALVGYQRALAIEEKLAAENPSVTKYQNDLAKQYVNLGNMQRTMGEPEAALVSHQRALAIREKLAAENPTVAEYQSKQAGSYHDLAFLQREMGDPEAALQSYERALAIQERLAAENRTVTDYQNNLARSYNNLGILHETTGNREAAIVSYERAQALQEKLAADHPEVVDYQLEFGGSCCNLGNLSGDAESAMVWFARAATALQGIVDRDDRHRNARLFLRNTYWGRAKVLGTRARYGEAADDWQRAAELDDGGMRTALRFSRADALARAGDHARAAAEAGEIAMFDRIPAEMLYNLACVVSLCAAAAKDDAALANPYTARAVDLLSRAKSAGFFDDAANVEQLGNDPDLDALRDRDDFRKFVDELPKSPPKSEE